MAVIYCVMAVVDVERECSNFMDYQAAITRAASPNATTLCRLHCRAPQSSEQTLQCLFGSSGDNYNDCGRLGIHNIANRRSTRQLGRRVDNGNINDKPSRVWERTWQSK